MAKNLLIVGASVRAACYSAARAGFFPQAIDLFGDVDLHRLCPVQVLAMDQYPRGLPELSRSCPSAPWLYTGGLENYPRVVDQIARHRPLWGNPGAVLHGVRNPFRWTGALKKAGLPCLEVHAFPQNLNPHQSWLNKPRGGAGGRGIVCWPDPAPDRKRRYFQEKKEGSSFAACFLAAEKVSLLGVTRQLVGEPWLHAGTFQYCGSVGPIPLSPALENNLLQAGNTLALSFGLRGLFGVDFIRTNDIPWIVEVNPRYTASMEILELTTGIPFLALHAQVFGDSIRSFQNRARPDLIAKGILFAREGGVFPPLAEEELKMPLNPWRLPHLADIPWVSSEIQPRSPVLTVFAEGRSEEDCLKELQRRVSQVEKELYEGIDGPCGD